MYNSGIFLVWPNLNESEICLQGWQIHTPLSKALYYWTPPWIPGCRLYVKWWIFAGLILLFAACDDACTTCCVVGKCYFLNLWVTAFYCFVDQLSWLGQRTHFRGSGDWRLTRMWTRIVFSETYFFEPDRCTHSVVLYSIKLKIMWIMIFTTTKEAGFLVYMSMFAKLIEINYVTLDAVYSWYKRICWGDWWNQRNAGSKTQLY